MRGREKGERGKARVMQREIILEGEMRGKRRGNEEKVRGKKGMGMQGKREVLGRE